MLAKLEPYNVQKVMAMMWNPPTFSFFFLIVTIVGCVERYKDGYPSMRKLCQVSSFPKETS